MWAGRIWLILARFISSPTGAVHRDGIADRGYGPYGVGAVGLRVIEPAHPRFLRVALVLVEALAIGLPEIEQRARDRLPVEAAHRASNEAGNTRAALGHVAAVRNRGGVRHVERPFHCARRRLAGLAMIDRIDQHAHAQHV